MVIPLVQKKIIYTTFLLVCFFYKPFNSVGQSSDFIDLTSTKFDKVTNIHLKTYEKKVDYSFSSFLFQVDFDSLEFKSIVYFNNVEFCSKVKFGRVIFNSYASFSGANFDSLVYFDETHFCSISDFSSTLFNSNVYFSLVKFRSEVRFNNAEFNSVVNFSSSNFSTVVDFSGAIFNSKPNFNEVALPDTLIFENVVTRDEIDFTNCYFRVNRENEKGYKCKINLVNTDLHKLKINYELFQLYFPNYISDEAKISTYEKVLKKFKDDGYLESYRKLDIEYQDFKNKMNGSFFLNSFLKHWWNYSYNKEWVLYWSFSIFLFFSLINVFIFNHLNNKIYEIHFGFLLTPDDALKTFKLLFSNPISSGNFLKFVSDFLRIFVNSLIYTSIIFFGLKMSLENFKKFSLWTTYIIFIYLAGLFCLAYIVNIIIVN